MNDPFNLTASILDRLLDMEPGQSNESARYRVVSEQQILNSVIRDIENLLNTRCNPIMVPDSLTRTKESLFLYGLKDFTVDNPESSFIRQKLCREIEKIISIFEPRLKKTIVRVESQEGRKRQLFFRISGTLMVEPLAEPVSFDTVFDLNRGQYVILK
jgi:type VI secretion system protein ImpF